MRRALSARLHVKNVSPFLPAGPLHSRVERQPLVEEAPGFVGPGGLEELDDAATGGQVDDRAVHERVVEFTELEQDPVDAGHVPQMGLRFPEELDGIVVALAEPEATTVALGLGRVVAGLVSHGAPRLPHWEAPRFPRSGSAGRTP